MKRLMLALSVVVVAFASSAWAHGGGSSVTCEFAHFWRVLQDTNNREIARTFLVFMNADPINETRILRLTVRDFFGNVVVDAGPRSATGDAIPPNTDFQVPVDVSTVPAGATYYLGSVHMFGLFPVGYDPALQNLDGNERGQTMQARIEYQKKGRADLFNVNSITRLRTLPGPITGPFGAQLEKSRTDRPCIRSR